MRVLAPGSRGVRRERRRPDPLRGHRRRRPRRSCCCRPGRSSTSGSGRRRCPTCRGTSVSCRYDGPGQRPLRPAARPGGLPPRRPGAATPWRCSTPPAPTAPWSSASPRPARGRCSWPPSTATGCWARSSICPSLAITDGHSARIAEGDPADLPASRVPFIERDPLEHWAKYDPAYWQDHHEDFLWFFFGMCFPEPHSTKQIEDCVAWGLDTTPDVLAAESRGSAARAGRRSRSGAARVTSPVLAIHGDHDLISPPSRGQTDRRADRRRVRPAGGRRAHPARPRPGAGQPADPRLRGAVPARASPRRDEAADA